MTHQVTEAGLAFQDMHNLWFLQGPLPAVRRHGSGIGSASRIPPDLHRKPMYRTPILYLDLDDTIISWEGGAPHAAPGATEFVDWALEHFEVRWLTTWCPSGAMSDKLLGDLSSMVRIPREVLSGIRGSEWEGTESKLNGIAWLEHRRPEYRTRKRSAKLASSPPDRVGRVDTPAPDRAAPRTWRRLLRRPCPPGPCRSRGSRAGSGCGRPSARRTPRAPPSATVS
jgi:hypothetical protein